MYRVILLCLYLLSTTQTRRALIALRDNNFVGADKQIARRLKEMSTITNNLDVDKILSEMTAVDRARPRGQDRARSAAANVTRQQAARRYDKYLNDPDDFNYKVVAMMIQVIYATQDRLKDLEPAVERYKGNNKTRIAFVMCTLDDWVIQMYDMYSMLLIAGDYPVIWRELVYYQHFTRKHIDIAYTVEHILQMNNDAIKKPKAKSTTP